MDTDQLAGEHLGVVPLQVLLRLVLELVEITATETRLAIREAGREGPAEAYVPTQTELRRSAEFAHAFERKPFLEAEIASGLAASRGRWQRGTSR
jgi:hypothetical protein